MKQRQIHHNDSFDRLIIAQSLEEEISIVTSNKIFKKYKVAEQIG